MNRSTPFDDAKYVSLRSYRKDGSPADTPVWVAPLDGKLMIFTLDDSYKVKRIARNPAVALATCDVRGQNLGEWKSGRCIAVERGSDEERRAYASFNRKYGLVMRLGTLMSTIVGRVRKRLVLAVTLD